MREEAICYALPIEDFIELTANNTAFAGFFFKDISHKLEALGQRQASPQALGAMTTRVRQAPVNPPVFVPPETTLHEAAVHMDRAGQRALLVRDGERIGIFTGVDLTRTAVAQRQPLETPVRDLVHYGVVGIDEDSFLFEAALLMARRRVRHLVVRREDEIVGVLDAANVLSSLANQADPIGALIDRAADPGRSRRGRASASASWSASCTTAAPRSASSPNCRPTCTGAPPPGCSPSWRPQGMAERACLVVMGSEGRGEYLTKTDQDNGIILADGYEPPDWDGLPPALHRRHDRCRLSRLPGRDHGPQSRLVEAAQGLVRRCPRLGADARTSRR